MGQILRATRGIMFDHVGTLCVHVQSCLKARGQSTPGACAAHFCWTWVQQNVLSAAFADAPEVHSRSWRHCNEPCRRALSIKGVACDESCMLPLSSLAGGPERRVVSPTDPVALIRRFPAAKCALHNTPDPARTPQGACSSTLCLAPLRWLQAWRSLCGGGACGLGDPLSSKFGGDSFAWGQLDMSRGSLVALRAACALFGWTAPLGVLLVGGGGGKAVERGMGRTGSRLCGSTGQRDVKQCSRLCQGHASRTC